MKQEEEAVRDIEVSEDKPVCIIPHDQYIIVKTQEGDIKLLVAENHYLRNVLTEEKFMSNIENTANREKFNELEILDEHVNCKYLLQSILIDNPELGKQLMDSNYLLSETGMVADESNTDEQVDLVLEEGCYALAKFEDKYRLFIGGATVLCDAITGKYIDSLPNREEDRHLLLEKLSDLDEYSSTFELLEDLAYNNKLREALSLVNTSENKDDDVLDY